MGYSNSTITTSWLYTVSICVPQICSSNTLDICFADFNQLLQYSKVVNQEFMQEFVVIYNVLMQLVVAQ